MTESHFSSHLSSSPINFGAFTIFLSFYVYEYELFLKEHFLFLIWMILSTQILWGLQRWLAVVWCSQKAVLEESCMRALQPRRLGFIQQMDFPSALRWGVHQKPGRPTMVCVNSHFAVFLLCKPKYGEDHFAEVRGLLSLQSQKMFIHEKSICWALIICWQCFSEHTAVHSPGTSQRDPECRLWLMQNHL